MTSFPTIRTIALSALLWATASAAADVPGRIPPPKLVLVVMVDGLPQEQLTKNYDLFVLNGFRRLMDRGAWFSDAHQAHAFPVTAPGHAAILTGAYPYRHGVIANEWRTREGKRVYCVEDPAHHFIDGTPTREDDGTSPANLQASTLGDELRYASHNTSRVFGVTGKDRAAILMAGRTGVAYMYSEKTGRFTSTSYYMREHPAWWQKYFAANPQDQWFGQSWNPLLPPSAYARSQPDGEPWIKSYRGLATRFPITYGAGQDKPGEAYYRTLPIGPYVDEAMTAFSLELVRAEALGRNGATDVLALSFSGHDYVNHRFGPESPQSQDHLLRLDRMLAKLFNEIERLVGKGEVLIVLSADHGFTNAPEYNTARGFDARRFTSGATPAAINAAAKEKYGLDKLVTQRMTGGMTLDYAAIEAKQLNREELERFAARTAEAQPEVAFAFTRSQLERGELPPTRIGLLAARAWNRQMAIDVMVIQKPYHYIASTTTASTASHGMPYAYDTQVPLMFEGARWIKPGRYGLPAEVVDVAPTLATLLNTRLPSAAEGKVLGTMLRAAP